MLDDFSYISIIAVRVTISVQFGTDVSVLIVTVGVSQASSSDLLGGEGVMVVL